MKNICVVHLVRASNRLEPFRKFLESYQINHGELEHDLLIVFKGFNKTANKNSYMELIASYKHRSFEVSDQGFDIAAYFKVVQQYGTQYRYFCFLNSFSEILDYTWLSKLYLHVLHPQVGIVGASGSWQSHKTQAISWRYLPDAAISAYRLCNEKFLWKRIFSGFSGAVNHIAFLHCFKAFPNAHIRTNAFMISSELMKGIDCPTLRTKMDAYKFESGKEGLTIQVQRRGLKVLVVGRDGVGYDLGKWNESKTFWQYEQQNLLVADNQTRDYQNGSLERRNELSCYAWRMNCETTHGE